ncbi:hypothetical protein pb186bvf_021181 [Paramecium bursaria]
MDYSKLLNQIHQLLEDISKTSHNLLIIGPTGVGKSTIANAVLSGNEQRFLIPKGSGGCFLPKTQGNFKVSQDFTQSMTSIPQCVQINNQFTLWDLPGFGDNRSVEIDVQTTLLSSLILSKSQKSLIMLVIPHKQFISDKAQKLVEILNMITDENANIVLVISKAEKKLTSRYIKSFITNQSFDDQLEQNSNEKQTRLSECSKKLLKKIIDSDQILIFRQPIPCQKEGESQLFQEEEVESQFCQENLNEIKKVIFDQKWYTELKFQLKYSPRAQEYIDNMQQKLLADIQNQELNLQRNFIQNNLIQLRKQSDIQQQLYHQQKLQFDHDYKQYMSLVNCFNDLLSIIEPQSKAYNSSTYDNNIMNIERQISTIHDQNTGNELYISGLKYSSAQLMNKLNKYQQQSIRITEIHILSIMSFLIDGDLTLPGVNIHITTQEFIVQQKSIINLKGQKGEQFQKAKILNKELPHSYQGRQGQNGGSLQIQAKQFHNLDSLTVNISGGDGGDGQDGADGLDGQNGEDGDKSLVDNRNKLCYVKYEELPISWAQNLSTFNRTFNCYFISKGQNGTRGGDSRKGGYGGDQGDKGILQINSLEQINVIDNQCQKGFNGKDGVIGKGGESGKNYVGINKVVKIFGRIAEPDNLETKLDNLGEGFLGNGVTTVTGTGGGALGAGVSTFVASRGAAVAAQAGQQVATQVASAGSKLGIQAVIEGCVAGVTLTSVAVAAGVTLAAQGLISIIQILVNSKGEWVSKHYEPSNILANPGNLKETEIKKETKETKDTVSLFELGSQTQKKFIDEQLNKIELLYPQLELSNELIKESFQIPK